MHKRITTLSFIIGAFFLLVALVLIIGYFISPLLAAPLNLYAGVAFLLFALFMLYITPDRDE